MNLTNFQYNQNSHSKIKKFEIRTLTDESIQNYMTKDSYVHRFLKSFDHERINEIFDRSNNAREKTNSYETQEIANTELDKNYENMSQPAEYEEKLFGNSKEEDDKDNLKKNSLFVNMKHDDTFRLTHNHINLKKFKIVKKHKISDIAINLRRSHNFKSHNNLGENINSNLKYKEDYAEDLSRLKDTFKSATGTSKTPAMFKLIRNSYTDLTKRNENFISASNSNINFKHKSNQIENENFNTPNPKFQLYERSLFRTFNIDRKENVDSVEKMKQIIEHNEYLEGINQLPKISAILNQEKLKSVEIKLKSNKIMGERYNPLNFYHNQSKSTTRRNIYGGLFLH